MLEPYKNDDALDIAEPPPRLQKATCPAHTTEQQLLRRLDLRLVPVIIVLYFLSFLDRCVNHRPKFYQALAKRVCPAVSTSATL